MPKTKHPPLQLAIGAVIRRHRERLKLSQEDCADKVGIHRTYQGAVERGERNITLGNIVRFARAYGVSPSTLLAEAESAMKSGIGR
jgi:transcriptional regulator with XRE-family HTH domain